MSFRLIKIDEALRSEHFYLTADDECYCLGDYLPREGYQAGPVNSLISNIKKSLSKRGRPEYRYKDQDIARAGMLVRSVLTPGTVANATFVPIPPSRAKNDPLYDDRLIRILSLGQPPLDVRELVLRIESTRPHHEYGLGEKRPTPEAMYQSLRLDEDCLTRPLGSPVIIFDDVITNGTSFRACKRLVLDRFPGTRVIGLFIGRRKLSPTQDFEEFEDE